MIKKTNDLKITDSDELYYYNFHLDRYERLINLIKSYKTKGLLVDVGSFPFHFFYYLNKETKFSTIGLDLNPSRKKDFITENRLCVYECDVESSEIPLKDNFADIVTMSEILEHLGKNPIFALEEIHRILKKDGILILTTPNLYSLKNILSFLIGRGLNNPYEEYIKIKKYGHMGHIREYSKHETIKLLEKTNFKVVKHYFVRYNIPNSNIKQKISKTVSFFLPFFKPSQIFICKKTQ